MIEPLSMRVNALGWHVQIAMDPDQIVAAESLWNRIPSVIVFDHMGYVPEPLGTKHPVFTLIRKLIDKGRTWVKLSVIPANTKDGPPAYADVNKVDKLTLRPRRNECYGVATGRTLTNRPRPMTLCSSTCSLDGHPTTRYANAFSWRTLKFFTVLPSLINIESLTFVGAAFGFFFDGAEADCHAAHGQKRFTD